MDLNKVSLIGNLVKEPVSRKTSSGQSVARFALATNYVWSDYKTRKKREAVEFHNAVAWGKLTDRGLYHPSSPGTALLAPWPRS